MKTERAKDTVAKVCPACSSTTGVRETTEDEKAYTLGLYALHDFIGGIDLTIAKYYCKK